MRRTLLSFTMLALIGCPSEPLDKLPPPPPAAAAGEGEGEGDGAAGEGEGEGDGAAGAGEGEGEGDGDGEGEGEGEGEGDTSVSPFDACADEPRTTGHALHAKAALFDDAMFRMHVSPVAKNAAPVILANGADAADAGAGDVVMYEMTDNDGLWGSLALAAAAWRSSVEASPEALAHVDTLLSGVEARTRVTGTPGIFARAVVSAGAPALECPTDPAKYTPAPQKDGNKWVMVGDDGCLMVTDETGAFACTEASTSPEFAGWCFKDNMSRDEMAGHAYALGVVATAVPDDAIRARAAALLGEIADHLVENGLAFRDWDGRLTQHGRLYAMSLDVTPGFNAAMALGVLSTAAAATQREDLWQFVEGCLLDDPRDCLPWFTETSTSYIEHLPNDGLWLLGCRTNFNSVSMHVLSLDMLIAHTRSDSVRQAAQQALDEDVMHAGVHMDALEQNNAWYSLVWAIRKADAAGAPAFDDVRNAACQLRMFPVPYVNRDIAPRDEALSVCLDRSDEPMFDVPLDVADRRVTDYVWWKSPFGAGGSVADGTHVPPPTGYLLPYWMARAHGLFDAQD